MQDDSSAFSSFLQPIFPIYVSRFGATFFPDRQTIQCLTVKDEATKFCLMIEAA